MSDFCICQKASFSKTSGQRFSPFRPGFPDFPPLQFRYTNLLRGPCVPGEPFPRSNATGAMSRFSGKTNHDFSTGSSKPIQSSLRVAEAMSLDRESASGTTTARWDFKHENDCPSSPRTHPLKLSHDIPQAGNQITPPATWSVKQEEADTEITLPGSDEISSSWMGKSSATWNLREIIAADGLMALSSSRHA